MAKLTPEQVRRRERVEGVIRLIAPALNIMLAAGERVSHLVEPNDAEFVPTSLTGSERRHVARAGADGD